MSCNNNNSDINQTFIIEPLSITGGSPTLSACTALYTNEIISCSGDTTISLGTGIVYFNSAISASSVNVLNYYSGGTNLLQIFSGDTFITGGTLNYNSHTLTLNNNNSTSVVITGFTDFYTTGGTLVGDVIYFDRNDTLSAYTVDLSSIHVNDIYLTGGTFNQTTRVLDLIRNDNVTVSVSGFTDIFTTGATYSNGYVYFDRNDTLSAYTLSLTAITGGTDVFVTGGTLTGNTLELKRNDNAIISVDLTDLRFSGGTGHCVTDFYVTNIHGCSPITVHDHLIVLSGVTLDLPIQDNTQTQIVVRNSGSGDLQYRDVQSIISAATSQDIYVTGLTFSSNLLIVKRNDNVNFSVLLNNFSGLTITGDLLANTISANTISATTYFGNGSNLTGIPYVTGGTTNNTAHTYIFNNATGGTFTLNGLTDVFVTGGTYSAGTTTFRNNTGGTFVVNGFVTGDTFVTGLTFNNANYLLTAGRNDGVNLIANLSILATDMTITGGTYNNNTGVATFFNNSGGSFSVSGFMTGFTDTLVTGGTYNNPTGILTLNNSTGGTFNVTGFTTGDTFVSAYTYSNNAFTIKQNNGKPDLTAFINIMTGLTVNGSLSATTYYGNGSNLTGIPYVTGGSFNNSVDTLTLFRNSGSSITITGFTDFYTTGATLVGTTLYFNRNDQLSAYTVNIANSDYWISGSAGTNSVKLNNFSGNDALGNYSLSEGYNSTAVGDFSHSEGNSTISSGTNAHAEGFMTSAIGSSTHAEGESTKAIGDNSHAEGESTIASGDTSHAEGSDTRALGVSSHAEGNITSAIGIYSHAEGYNTTAEGDLSHSEGFSTTAIGQAAHAEGNNTIASGRASHAGGANNIFLTGVVKAIGVAAFNHSFVSQNEPISGASGDYSAILGGTNQNINNGATNSAILGGSANTINVGVTNSVIIGGHDLTATTSDTAYVYNLNIFNTPNDNSLTKFLVEDSNGNVKYRTLSSVLTGSTSITAFTYNNQNTFTISNSDGSNYSATFSTVTGLTLNGNITPSVDNTVDLGGQLIVTDVRFTGASTTGLTTPWTSTFTGQRFRNINTVSGGSTVWTSTYRVNTPNLDLGLDSSGITRVITADSSIIQDDILLGGTF